MLTPLPVWGSLQNQHQWILRVENRDVLVDVFAIANTEPNRQLRLTHPDRLQAQLLIRVGEKRKPPQYRFEMLYLFVYRLA